MSHFQNLMYSFITAFEGNNVLCCLFELFTLLIGQFDHFKIRENDNVSGDEEHSQHSQNHQNERTDRNLLQFTEKPVAKDHCHLLSPLFQNRAVGGRGHSFLSLHFLSQSCQRSRELSHPRSKRFKRHCETFSFCQQRRQLAFYVCENALSAVSIVYQTFSKTNDLIVSLRTLGSDLLIPTRELTERPTVIVGIGELLVERNAKNDSFSSCELHSVLRSRGCVNGFCFRTLTDVENPSIEGADFPRTVVGSIGQLVQLLEGETRIVEIPLFGHPIGQHSFAVILHCFNPFLYLLFGSLQIHEARGPFGSYLCVFLEMSKH